MISKTPIAVDFKCSLIKVNISSLGLEALRWLFAKGPAGRTNTTTCWVAEFIQTLEDQLLTIIFHNLFQWHFSLVLVATGCPSSPQPLFLNLFVFCCRGARPQKVAAIKTIHMVDWRIFRYVCYLWEDDCNYLMVAETICHMVASQDIFFIS